MSFGGPSSWKQWGIADTATATISAGPKPSSPAPSAPVPSGLPIPMGGIPPMMIRPPLPGGVHPPFIPRFMTPSMWAGAAAGAAAAAAAANAAAANNSPWNGKDSSGSTAPPLPPETAQPPMPTSEQPPPPPMPGDVAYQPPPPTDEKPPLPPDPPPPDDSSQLELNLDALKQKAQHWQMEQQRQQQWADYQQKLQAYNEQVKKYSATASVTAQGPAAEPQTSHHQPTPTSSQTQQQNSQQQQQQQQNIEKAREEYKLLTEEETNFNKQYTDWMKQYEDWKVQNKNHPDQKQFNEYAETWKEYEKQMNQKRSDIQKRKEAAYNKTIQSFSGPGTEGVPTSQGITTAAPAVTSLTSLQYNKHGDQQPTSQPQRVESATQGYAAQGNAQSYGSQSYGGQPSVSQPPSTYSSLPTSLSSLSSASTTSFQSHQYPSTVSYQQTSTTGSVYQHSSSTTSNQQSYSYADANKPITSGDSYSIPPPNMYPSYPHPPTQNPNDPYKQPPPGYPPPGRFPPPGQWGEQPGTANQSQAGDSKTTGAPHNQGMNQSQAPWGQQGYAPTSEYNQNYTGDKRFPGPNTSGQPPRFNAPPPNSFSGSFSNNVRLPHGGFPSSGPGSDSDNLGRPSGFHDANFSGNFGGNPSYRGRDVHARNNQMGRDMNQYNNDRDDVNNPGESASWPPNELSEDSDQFSTGNLQNSQNFSNQRGMRGNDRGFRGGRFMRGMHEVNRRRGGFSGGGMQTGAGNSGTGLNESSFGSANNEMEDHNQTGFDNFQGFNRPGGPIRGRGGGMEHGRMAFGEKKEIPSLLSQSTNFNDPVRGNFVNRGGRFSRGAHSSYGENQENFNNKNPNFEEFNEDINTGFDQQIDSENSLLGRPNNNFSTRGRSNFQRVGGNQMQNREGNNQSGIPSLLSMDNEMPFGSNKNSSIKFQHGQSSGDFTSENEFSVNQFDHESFDSRGRGNNRGNRGRGDVFRGDLQKIRGMSGRGRGSQPHNRGGIHSQRSYSEDFDSENLFGEDQKGLNDLSNTFGSGRGRGNYMDIGSNKGVGEFGRGRGNTGRGRGDFNSMRGDFNRGKSRFGPPDSGRDNFNSPNQPSEQIKRKFQSAEFKSNDNSTSANNPNTEQKQDGENRIAKLMRSMAGMTDPEESIENSGMGEEMPLGRGSSNRFLRGRGEFHRGRGMFSGPSGCREISQEQDLSSQDNKMNTGRGRGLSSNEFSRGRGNFRGRGDFSIRGRGDSFGRGRGEANQGRDNSFQGHGSLGLQQTMRSPNEAESNAQLSEETLDQDFHGNEKKDPSERPALLANSAELIQKATDDIRTTNLLNSLSSSGIIGLPSKPQETSPEPDPENESVYKLLANNIKKITQGEEPSTVPQSVTQALSMEAKAAEEIIQSDDGEAFSIKRPLSPMSVLKGETVPKVIDYGHGKSSGHTESSRFNQPPRFPRQDYPSRFSAPSFHSGPYSPRDFPGGPRFPQRDPYRDNDPHLRGQFGRPEFHDAEGWNRDRDSDFNGRQHGFHMTQHGRLDRNNPNSRDFPDGRPFQSNRHGPPDHSASRFEDTMPIQVLQIDELLCHPGRRSRPQQIVILMRGPPGAGKTYVAKLIKDKEVANGGTAPRILALDDYFMVEGERAETDTESGKRIKRMVMEYVYEPEMEKKYRTSMLKSFKKQVDNGHFNFLIVDAINHRISDIDDYWSHAKSKGFQVYILEIIADLSVCVKRNLHNRKMEDIKKILDRWEPTPRHMIRLDIRTLLQEVTITDVEMCVESEDKADSTDKTTPANENVESSTIEDEEEQTQDVPKSKWELDASDQKLDKLDGLIHGNKNEPGLRPEPKDMEDYLQLPDDYESRLTSVSGKRVRWADVEEKQNQERSRKLGFVVGQTDWEKITDDEYANKQMNKTKYI